MRENFFWVRTKMILSTGNAKSFCKKFDKEKGDKEESVAFWGFEALREFNFIPRRVFNTFEFVNKDITATFSLYHVSYLGNYLVLELTDYKDKLLERYEYPIPKEVYGLVNHQEANWDSNIHMMHDKWAIKVVDTVVEDKYHRDFTFEDKNLGISAQFKTIREKEEYAGHYGITSCDNLDSRWWHNLRIMGVDTTGNLKWKNKNWELTDKNVGRHNWHWLAGHQPFKAGQISAVINHIVINKKQLNFYTTTGLSNFDKRNRANFDMLWINEIETRMEPITFEFDRSNMMKPWKVETHNLEHFKKNRSASLTFTPFAEAGKKIDYFFMKRDFNRIAGFYDGWVRDENGEEYKLDKAQGYVTLNYVQG